MNEARSPGSRDAILELLEHAIEDIQRELGRADPETPEQQRLQLQRYHEIGYLANQFRKLKRDTDLDSMAEELAVLKDKGASEGS